MKRVILLACAVLMGGCFYQHVVAIGPADRSSEKVYHSKFDQAIDSGESRKLMNSKKSGFALTSPSQKDNCLKKSLTPYSSPSVCNE